jgi:hypothetical protein
VTKQIKEVGVCMTQQQAVETLGAALVTDASGRFSFACRKALVRIKIRGRSAPFLFRKCDQVAFRVGAQALIIERIERFTIKKCLDWADSKVFPLASLKRTTAACSKAKRFLDSSVDKIAAGLLHPVIAAPIAKERQAT